MAKVVKGTINKDLKDEKNAKEGYRKLAKTLRGRGEKQAAITVMSISRDEADHFRRLTKIKKSL
jgi:rubrerythrin